MSLTLLDPASPAISSRKWPNALTAILAVGAAIRLLLWVWFIPVSPHVDDELAHVRLATNLVEHGEYTFNPDGELTSLRPPLYPAFVAAIFKIAGVNNFQAVRFVQAILSLFTVVFVFFIARNMYSERVGTWAAGFQCFYPSLLGYNNLMLSEVLFTFLLVAGVFSIACAMRRTRYSWLISAGILLGSAALTRSIIYPCAPFLALFIAVTWRGSLTRRAFALMAFAIPFTGILAPWAIRNTLLQKTFIPIDCMGGRNFMMGNYEYTPLYRSWDAISIDGDREWFQVLKSRRPEVLGATQGQIDKYALAEGAVFVRDNPGLTVKRDLIKFFDFWGLERELVAGASKGYFGPVPGAATVILGITICGLYILILFAGSLGVVFRPNNDARVLALILFLGGFMCAVHSIVFAHSRYHLPLVPFAIIFAAAMFVGTHAETKRWRAWYWVAFGFCALVAAGWMWNAAIGDYSKLLTTFGMDK